MCWWWIPLKEGFSRSFDVNFKGSGTRWKTEKKSLFEESTIPKENQIDSVRRKFCSKWRRNYSYQFSMSTRKIYLWGRFGSFECFFKTEWLQVIFEISALKNLIMNFRIGSFAFGQNSTISCISSSQESDLLFIGIDYPSGGGGEIVIFNPFLSIRLKRIRNVF